MAIYIIKPSNDLKQLEQQKHKFDNLTYEDKNASNDEAIRLYGKSNETIYNICKANLLDNVDPNILNYDDTLTSTIFSESFSYSSDENEVDDFDTKIELAKQAENKGFILIYPISSDNNYCYSLDILNKKFNEYNLLSIDMQMMSDSESISIFGNDVKYIYYSNRVKLLSNDYSDEIDIINKSNIDNYINNISEDCDILEAALNKLEMISIKENGLLSESVLIDNYLKNSKDDNLYISSLVPEISPYLTYDEVCELLIDENDLKEFKENFFIEDYIDNFIKNYQSIKEMSLEYLSNPTELLEQKLIKFGWNPSVSITPTSLNIGKIKNSKYIKENSVDIIDLTNYSVLESSDVFNTKSKTDIDIKNNDELVPIYIVLLYVGSPFGKAIKKVTKSTYSHAAIGFSSDLNMLYSYSTSTVYDSNGGFVYESIGSYIESGKINNTPAKIQVLTLFVSQEEKEILNNKLKFYINNQEKSTYDFKNIFRILINKKYDMKDSLSMVCSEFVDFILKTINIDITNKKSSNLVTPKDFEKVNHPKVFKIYEGLAEDYNAKKIDYIIRSIKLNKANLFKTVPLKEMVSVLFEHRDIILFKSVRSDNDEANLIMDKINDIITAESVITESKFPISFKNNGDLSIELPKKLENEYQKSHTLLLEYDKNGNIKGMKNEISKLWYMNNKIESKLRSKKEPKNKDEYIKLRARILNDFKKYLSVIMNTESDFNFSEYFNDSPYYDKSISVDQNTIKWTASSLKKIILSL